MVKFFEKVGKSLQSATLEASQCQTLIYYVMSILENTIEGLNANIVGKNEPVSAWAALKCYPFLIRFENHENSLTWEFIKCIDMWLSTTQGVPTCLSSFYKCFSL
jgi:hypothetical protein